MKKKVKVHIGFISIDTKLIHYHQLYLNWLRIVIIMKKQVIQIKLSFSEFDMLSSTQ